MVFLLRGRTIPDAFATILCVAYEEDSQGSAAYHALESCCWQVLALLSAVLFHLVEN